MTTTDTTTINKHNNVSSSSSPKNDQKRLSNSTIQSLLQPGKTRVRDADGFVGTIQYVGPVASAKDSAEIYAGIVWDDGTRGKHDGSVICRRTNQLARHFSCPSPYAGSFLRLSKLDLGVELDAALLRSKYVTKDAPIVAPNNILPHVAKTSSGRDKPIEFHGELQIRAKQQLENIDEISLRGLGVARPTSSHPEEMREFRHLREIDLAGNLLCDWEAVVVIMKQFPNLENVSFASNRICDIPPTVDIAMPDEFPRMKVLNLNHCSIGTFQTIQTIGLSMPNLEELCVAYSDLSDMDTFDLHTRAEENRVFGGSREGSDCEQATSNCSNGEEENYNQQNHQQEEDDIPVISGFHNLKLLDLSSCKLTSWDRQIRRLRSFPRLEDLDLNDNKIPFVSTPPARTLSPINNDDHNDESERVVITTEFPTLTSLQLAGGAIESWSGIDALSLYPTLKSLRFRNNPVTSTLGAGEARAIIIARLPQIESLNASPISTKERMEAERRYVSLVAREMLLVESSFATQFDEGGNTTTQQNRNNKKKQDVLKEHPRFQHLVKKHGDTMTLATSRTGNGSVTTTTPNYLGGNIANDAINVTIRSMSASSCSVEPLRKRLPASLKVGRLKAMCSRAFNLDIELQMLHFRTEDDPFPTELDDDDNPLSYYGVGDGAEILMNEIDLEAKRREEAREAEEYNKRVSEQERVVTALQELQRSDVRAHSIAVERAADRSSTQ